MTNRDVKLFIAELMNEENDKYSILLLNLRDEIGDTEEFNRTQKILLQVHNAKIKILEKIYGVL